MTTPEKTKYTAEQLKRAEQMAQLLQSDSEKKQNIIVMMGNAFISGLEVGMQFPLKDVIKSHCFEQ